MSELRVIREGSKLAFVVDGKLLFDTWTRWQDALEIAQLIRNEAKQAEAHDKAAQIIEDGAILARAGASIGLTGDRATIDEIAKEAAWNRDLRRYMPGGVKSAGKVGKPNIKHT
jgi:hypothetical protein